MKTIKTDVAIVGAGSAGLSAACQAASAGADVLVIDENSRPGGQLFKQIHKFFGSSEHQAGVRGFEIGRRLLGQVEACGARVMLDSLVYGLMKDKTLGVISGGCGYRVEAGAVVIAAGAKENYMPFPGATLPGVMGAGAAQTMINVNLVLPGKRMLMIGSGNVGLIVSYQLLQAGAEVAAVVEAAPRIGGYGVHAAKIRRAGVPILVGHTVTKAWGDGQVERAEVAALDEKWRVVPGSETIYEVDTICLAVGLNPMTELVWMVGCAFEFIPALGGHVPLHDADMETTVKGLYVAGDVTGVEEASSAMEEGNLAGVAAAQALGFLPAPEAEAKKAEIRARLEALRSGLFGAGRRASKERQLTAMDDYMKRQAASIAEAEKCG